MIFARHLPFILALVLAVGSSGCVEEPAAPLPSQPKVNRPVPNTPPVETAAAEDEPVEPKYVYTPGGRDPFESLLDIRKPVTRSNEPQTPLQKFDVNQLRLVGVITGMEQPKAMVVAPDGKSYVLEKGTKVGKNNGVVTKIDRSQIVVKESFYDFTGEVRTNLQTIELPKREGV